MLNSLRDRFRYALIDESRDTDELQWTFFKRVFVDSDRQNIVYLIGDPKQSIYGFRGADVNAFLAAGANRRGSGAGHTREQSPLDPELIAAYNMILDPAATPPFSTARSDTQTPVKPGRKLGAIEQDGTRSSPVHVLEIEPKGEALSKNELFRRPGAIRLPARPRVAPGGTACGSASLARNARSVPGISSS